MSESKTKSSKPKSGIWTFSQLLLWYFVFFTGLILLKVFYRMRVRGIENIPRDGAFLFVSNHQSFLDPVIIGCASRPRPFVSLARKTLFTTPFGGILRKVMTIPVDQDASSDLTSMRTCLNVLKKGYGLLVFAEGSRTYDGHVGEFSNGVAMLMKRAKPTVVLVAIEGAYDIWPRGNKKPKWFGKVSVTFSKPREVSEILNGPVTECMEKLRLEVEQMREQARCEMKLPQLPVAQKTSDSAADQPVADTDR